MFKFKGDGDHVCPHCVAVEAFNMWLRRPECAAKYIAECREVAPVEGLTDKQIALGGLVQALGTMLGETLKQETDDTSGVRIAKMLDLFNQALGAEVQVEAVVAVPNVPPGGSDPGTRH